MHRKENRTNYIKMLKGKNKYNVYVCMHVCTENSLKGGAKACGI